MKSLLKMAGFVRGFQNVLFGPARLFLSEARAFHTGVAGLGSVEEEFQAASEKVKTLKEDPGNDNKLKLYALFKQVGNLKDLWHQR